MSLTLPFAVLGVNIPLEDGLVLTRHRVLVEEVPDGTREAGEGVTGPAVGGELEDGCEDVLPPCPRLLTTAPRRRVVP